MVFQVTQCPHCESTFNINPRILEMASGQVRCGACLEVFPARDNLLSTLEEIEQQNDDESVFIGGQPADFFDPSLFLTRSALTDEAQQSSEEASPDLSFPDEETESGTPPVEGQQGSLLPETNTQEEDTISSASPDPAELPDHAAEQAIDEDTRVVNTTEQEEHLEFFAAIDESLQHFDESEDISELQEIAALNPHDSFESTQPDPFVEDPIDLEGADESTERASPESVEEEHPPTAPQDPKPRPEEFSLSASFALQFGAAQGAAQQTENESQHTDQDAEQEPGASAAEQAELETLERQVREAIDEQDFAAAVEVGLREPATVPANDWYSGPATEAESDGEVASEMFEIGELDPAEEAEDLHQAEEVQEFLSAVAEAEAELSASDDPQLPDAPESQESDVDTSTEAIRARALHQELEDEEALEQIPQENLDNLEQIAPPVQLLAGQRRSLGKRLSMLVLILVLGGLLAGQYLWRYRDSYSLDPRFRAAYQIVCAQLACELPEYTSIEEIRSDNLAVRSHPEREDGLMVTVEIRNSAPFPQKFPILILGFNSANNEVIALREFAPAEYLDEGLQQFELMPIASPVQVTLPIMDPGDDAVNYTLAFRTP